ncbi:MAG: 1-acyl-sn-glycerol-3-phosphate acyltransferase [Micavibrio aeruginosavorus]|uniref:1-acyl-sn-glycerol-3-phosphate acyltransferase n=1 Tax=Micavibrio aeruginosavorus TaxID=349221 RepID=A0A2W5C438_9BACT|nr:MAG: 1-acyl-sn-glycerol-3-phosphate acyltransferase [Micavibrio aeruginosavorus]
MDKIRSVIFNILFYGIWAPFICLSLLPTLLMPRAVTLWVAEIFQHGAHVLMKYVLGLDYELRGLEHRPKDGTSYLVAAKHYSAYETLKLFVFFKDPAVILKRELLSVPVFGWYLRKLEVVAIDRGSRTDAMNSLYAGARKVRDQARPITIYPQGTRVAVDATTKEKPYKGGIIKLYKELDIPIYPLATNSGLYWPRNAFWKKSGKVIFEFLPPIQPGLPPEEAMRIMEEAIETASNRLVAEGRRNA